MNTPVWINLKTLRYCFIFLATLFCLEMSGTDIYVSPTGNDKNPGTKDQPLATLTGARDFIRDIRVKGTVNGRINVIFMKGTYFMSEPLVLSKDDSGNEGSPVIYRSDAGAEPVFKGGIEITGWEKVSDKLWKAKVPEVTRFGLYFEQLYVNGLIAVRAKSPNQGFYYVKKVSETVLDQRKVSTENEHSKVYNLAGQKISIFPQDAAAFASFSANDFEDAVLNFYHKWDNTRKRITAFNADSSAIFTIGNGMKSWNVLDRKTRYTVENFKAALDTAGEWYLDHSGYLYYIPREGEIIEKIQVLAPIINKFIIIKGDGDSGKKVENIRFENLHFMGAGYRMPLLGDEPSQTATPVEATVMADYATNIEFVNCEISQTGIYAIWFRKDCKSCSVSHCYLHDLGAGGIKIGDIVIPDIENKLTRNILIDNNIIKSGGFVFPCAVGIVIYHSSDNTVTHNDIADFRYSAVSVGWVWGSTYSPSKRNHIDFNHIHHIGWGVLSDMGGVYCLGESEGTTVSNNVIHNVYSIDYGGWGLYTDEGSTAIVMENNLVYSCKSSAFHQNFGKENIIRNNIFANQIRAQLETSRIDKNIGFHLTKNIIYYYQGNLTGINWDRANFESDYNVYWDTRLKDITIGKKTFKEWQKSGKDTHSVIADPGFINPQMYDFKLKKNSIALKMGFKPFDYSKAGVYGSSGWLELARLDPELARQFDEAVKRGEAKELRR